MNTVTDNDLQQLKDLINQRFGEINNNIIELKLEQRELKSSIDHLDSRLTNLETNINTVDKNTGKIEAKIEAWKPILDKIPDLSEKVGELKNWRQITLIIITGVLTTLFWFIRDGRI